jgi:ABC-2 type transport system permease protein
MGVAAMRAVGRYVRLLTALGRYGLARELAFRGNFLIKLTVEILWLFILLFFYRTVFTQTRYVANWSEPEYLFFVGCYFSLAGLIETLFLSNCNEFADLIRSGDLDIYLLQPIDEQFLVTCRSIDWSTAANVLLGAVLMGISLAQLGWVFDPVRLLLFLVLFGCGVAIAYSLMLLLTSTSVWFMRNQSLYELWWLFTSLMRYPREIFAGTWFAPVSWFFTFVIPVLLVINVPASLMIKVFDPWIVLFTGLATVVLLWASRRFFQYALRRYRSASS